MADKPDVKTWKQTLTHVLEELGHTPFENIERRDKLYAMALELEQLMAMRHKVKEGRPRGTTKRKIIEASKARAQALKQPLNPGVALALQKKIDKEESKEPL